MAKGKKPSTNKGANGRKNHGPKTHIHHSIEPKALRFKISQTGLLSKYDDYEAWAQACAARGNPRVTRQEFEAFAILSMEKKRAYFDKISHKSK